MRRLLCLLILSCSALPAVAGALLIRNVTLIPMDEERSVPGQSVLVRDGRIAAIAPTDELRAPEGATVIDGSGRWLMPGLTEMHAHVPPVAQHAALQRVLELFLVNGVTSVRGVLGEPGHLALRASLERGETFGPRLFTSGPSLNGNSVGSPDQARQLVAAQKAAGYDLLKLHPGLSPENFQAIMASAAEHGIPATGHVSAAVGLLDTLSAGQQCIEHLDDYVRALAADDSPARSADPGFFGLAAVDAADAARIPLLVEATRRAGAAVTPTETLMVNLLGTETLDSLLARPESAYVSAAARQQWSNAFNGLRGSPGFDSGKALRFLALRRELLRALHEGGVPVLLGSDAPQVFNVPGFSSHRELALMVEAGLTPWQALRSGTRAAAEHMGRSDQQGRIAEGLRADLILLSADPLQDIANIRRIEGVVAGGRWHDRGDLDSRLARIRAEVGEG